MNDFFVALTLYPAATLTFALIFGLLIGSFLNVVIYRLPKMMEADWREQCAEICEEHDEELCNNQTTSNDLLAATDQEVVNSALNSELAVDAEISHPPAETESEPEVKDSTRTEAFNLLVPRSRCPHCGHKITALENIPIISYLCLGGKCSGCQAPISIRYPIIELVTGLLSMFVIYVFGATYLGLAVLVFTWCLIALTMIDIDTHLLPDDITLPLVWVGLIINSFSLITSLEDALWGAVCGYLFLWSIYWLFKLITRKEGMGYGDFKLYAALGAWMGWQYLPQIILLSSLVGAVIGIALMIIKRRGKDIPIPFGPYLAIAGWIALIWGDHINKQYLQLFVAPF